jgi:hypothetical protein
MKNNFCTLFNSAYLSRGLVLYRSLENTCADFHLYVFAFDEKCELYLKKQNFRKMTVVGLKEFEDPELLRIKQTRSAGEYCWTCTASTILFSIEKFGLDHCTYIDSDMEFYHDPNLLLQEVVDKDVLITDHWYSPKYDQSEESGKYCVQFVFFRNNENGMRVLRDWRNDCNTWCFDRVEDGKFGDQKYLDDWQSKYPNVHVMQNRGGGVAPWNIQQYRLEIVNGKPMVQHKSEQVTRPLVFFHYHGLKFFNNDLVGITTVIYDVQQIWKNKLFFPYVQRLLMAGDEIRKNGGEFNPHGNSGEAPVGNWGVKVWLYYYLASVKESFGNIGGRVMDSRKRHHPFYSLNRFR